MSHMKNNRKLLISTIVGVALLIFIGISLWVQVGQKKELEETHASLLTGLNTAESNIAKRQAELDAKKSDSIKEATGLDPSLIGSDTESAKAFFGPVFNWKSGAEYDKVRNDFMELLGEGNSFTATYLPADTKIDTNDGPLSYIDHKGLQTSMVGMNIVPLKAEGDRIRYVSFVRYFMHQAEEDTVNPEALEESEAIIEFTAEGDSENGGRRVTEVSARAGFHSSLTQ